MDVGLALRNSSKGQLKYDKYWFEEGRTKEILDDISKYSSKISVQISPKILSFILDENQNTSKNGSGTQEEHKKSTSAKAKTNKKIEATDAYFYELQAENELPIQSYEEERIKYLQDVFENKKKEFDRYSLEVQEQMKQEYLLAKRKNELDARRRTGELHKQEQLMMKEAEEMIKLQKEQHQSHVKKLSAKILEAELKQKQAEEEVKKKLQEQEELQFQLKTCFQEAQNVVSKCFEKLNSCEHQKYLSVSCNDRSNQLSELLNYISNLISQAKDRELTIDDILNANLHVQKACEILQEISSDIESSKAKISREQGFLVTNSTVQENTLSRKSNYTGATKNLEKNPNLAAGELTTPENITPELMDKTVASSDKETKSDAKEIVSHFIAPDAVEHYDKIKANFNRVNSLVQSLKSDAKNKKYRFELQKAINVPINSLSSNSGSQIKVKMNRLLAILTGKAPETSGQDLSTDSVVYNFCANLIAKQFVEQGDTQISSQHSTAFPIAFAALGVWLKQPAVGELLLGHFYERCPYLVPYYPPQEENQTNEDYFLTLGYKLNEDGSVESKHKFLNRISGYVRLYAAIIQSPLPPNVNSPHPHGIAFGWKWLSRVLNLDPRPDITATVLYDFLDVAGYSLQKAYGKQFNKMLHILCKGYFKKIKQVTPGGSGGPLERLEIFLQKTAKTGRISPPEGHLDANFWVR